MASRQAGSNPRGTDSAWSRAEERILSHLGERGIIQAYCDNGLRWGSTPYRIDGKGNAGHAVKGFDSSVRIHVRTGWYRDWNGGTTGSLWDYCELHGRYSDWRAARQHYADRTGVTLPGTGREYRRDPRGKVLPTRPAPAGRSVPQWRDDLSVMAVAMHAAARADGTLARTAQEMGVAPHSLDDLHVGVVPASNGWVGDFNWYPGYTTWPEITITDDSKRIVMSMMQRPPAGVDGQKWCLKNRPRGITIPEGWMRRVRLTGHLLICEGASDVAAATSMELGALGYWASGQGGSYLVSTIRRAMNANRLPKTFVIVCTRDIDDDGQPNKGTAKIAQELATRLGMPVYQRCMPTNPNYVEPPEQDRRLAPVESDRVIAALAASQYGSGPAAPTRSRAYKDVRKWLQARCDFAHICGRRDQHLVALGRTLLSQIVGPWELLALDENGFWPLPPCQTHEAATEQEREQDAVEDKARARKAFDNYWFRDEILAISLASKSVPSDRSFKGGKTEENTSSSLKVPISGTDLDASEIVSATFAQPPLDALTAASWTPCPEPLPLVLQSLNDPSRMWATPAACRHWHCVGCGPRRRLDWARAVREAMEEIAAAGGECYMWRGTQAKFAKTVVKANKGNYFRVMVGDVDVLVVATRAFPSSAPIGPVEADAELIAAITALTPVRPPRGSKTRLRPISASTPWRVTRAKSCVSSRRICTRQNGPAFDAVMKTFGFRPDARRGEDRTNYTVPYRFDDRDIEAAVSWAKIGLTPPGWCMGDAVPPTSVLAGELIDLPVRVYDEDDRWPVPPAPPVPPAVRPRPRQQQPSLPMTTEGHTIPPDLDWA